MKTAVYPGSFDPITNGHLDILERSLAIFDRVILAVAVETQKKNLFDLEERIELVREAVRNYERVDVEGFDGLLMHYVVRREAGAIIRGLRAVSDFEYEFQLSLMNRNLNSDVETVFLMTSAENTFISSSMIRQVSSLGGEITGLVPEHVERALKRKYGIQGE